ncbi:hypothetical protein PMAYCL1PPCAC_22363, partial [Pristionchus mayeri]
DSLLATRRGLEITPSLGPNCLAVEGASSLRNVRLNVSLLACRDWEITPSLGPNCLTVERASSLRNAHLASKKSQQRDAHHHFHPCNPRGDRRGNRGIKKT